MDFNLQDKIKKSFSSVSLPILSGKKLTDIADSDPSVEQISRRKEKEIELKPLEIGFKVESRFETFQREFRKKRIYYFEELKIGGFYSDLWMWNLVFINLLAFIITTLMISQNYTFLPGIIGVNTNDDRYLDLILPKSTLYILPAFHIIVTIVILYFGSKSQKRLSHLFASSFFQVIVIIIFEIMALQSYIQYFR